MAAAMEARLQEIDAALTVQYATTLALGVLGLQAELNAFAVSEEETARRVNALGTLAADLLKRTAALEGEVA
jgi:hypothetical protein